MKSFSSMQMENQRKNSGAEQEKQRQALQKAQDAIKNATKDMKDIKQKLTQVINLKIYSIFAPRAYSCSSLELSTTFMRCLLTFFKVNNLRLSQSF
jgi:trans-2-enoyl-CoA reductase